jgi:predicted aspartyl protease
MSALALTIGTALALAGVAEAPVEPALAAIGNDAEIIRTQTDRDRRMTVPVRIGANADLSQPFRFVIDTGSQTTVLSRDIAARMALRPGRRARVVSIGGSEFAETAIVGEMGLGRRSFSDLEVLLFEGHHIGADGIVGIDSLQRQRVLLDFAANQMTVGDTRSTGGNRGFDIVVTARRKLGQLIMADAVIDGIPVNVVIDTGAETSVGNRALQRALRQRGVMEQVTLTSVTGHQIQADIAYSQKLSIGNADISRLMVAYVDSPVFTVLDLERRPAMLLGMRELRLFKRVAVDFASRKVYFDLPS